MPHLRVTSDELRAATFAVYGLSPEHAPGTIWVDHLDESHSYVRATFPGEACVKCRRKLWRVVMALRRFSGNNPTLTVIVYEHNDSQTVADERHLFLRNRLAGFKP